MELCRWRLGCHQRNDDGRLERHITCYFDPVGPTTSPAHVDIESMSALNNCAGIGIKHGIINTLKQSKCPFLHTWKTRKGDNDQQTKAHGLKQQETLNQYG